MGYTEQIVVDGPPALHALRAAIDTAQAGSPLDPVAVVVPSNSVAVAARRWLAAHGGIAAVQFVTTYRLAELLGAPTLVAAGRRPVNTPIVDVAVRRALDGAPGMFEPVAHHHATITALRNIHRELRHVPSAALDRITAAGSRRGRDVVRLHRDIAGRLTSDWYDEADLLATATATVRAGSGPAKVIRFLPERSRPTEQRLVAALATAGQVHAIVADGVLRPPEEVELVDVSDADEEAREAVRQVVTAIRGGVALERIAIVWPLANPYARLISEHLDAAGIVWNGRPGVALHERLAARLLVDVLGIDRRGLRRSDLFEVLANVPSRRADGRPVPRHRWERISRRAGVAAGVDWDGRLAEFERRCTAAPKGIGRVDAESAAGLREFVDELRLVLGGPDVVLAWQHWARLCHRLLDRWLGGQRGIAHLPAVEIAAHEEVQGVVDRLGQLDGVDGPVARSSFLDALIAELEASPARSGRIGQGVQVGPLSYALGQSLDLVVVLGASDGQLPSPPSVDPLLDDADRSLTGGALALSCEQLDEQRRSFAGALAAGARAVVIRPRGDLRTTVDRQPSRWIAEITLGPDTRRRTVPSFVAGLADVEFPSTPVHHRLRALSHHVRAGRALDDHPLAHSLPALRRGLATVRARESTILTEYDGDLTGAGVASPLAGGEAVSPTRLEAWAACPYAYFVQYVLRVQPVEDPGLELRITPLDQGSLVHDALDRFHHLVIDGILPQPGPTGWGPEHLAALLAEFDAVQQQFAERGLVGRPAAWVAARARLHGQIRRWLDEDGKQIVLRGARIMRSEYAFGPTSRDPDAGPAAVLTLAGGRTLHMRGKIDRVDRGADGIWYVTDHKTGNGGKYRGVSATDPTLGGSVLQLPAYAAVVAALDPDGDGLVEAEYSFVAPKEKRPFRTGVRFELAVWSLVDAQLERVIGGIESGLFFARVEQMLFKLPFVACPYCDPDGLGTAELYAQMLRKSGDARMRAALGLIDDAAP